MVSIGISSVRLPGILRKKVKPGVLGLEVGPYGIAMAWVDRSHDMSGGPCECHYIEGNDLAKNGAVLKRYLTDESLLKMPTHVILHPSMYDIFFVDRPAVEDHELADAVRWLMKDLIDTPLKDLVIDAFAVPDDAYRGKEKKVYAVSTRKNFLEEIISTVKQSGLVLKSIGIDELAVMNILGSVHQENTGSAAMLRMRKSSGTLYLSDGGNLYVTRHIESGLSKLESGNEVTKQQVMDELLLEIQRSLDYYYSQLGKGAIRNFLIAPWRHHYAEVDQYLCDNLDLKVRSLDINDIFDTCEGISSKLQASCFGAIGAACGEIVN